MTTAATILTTRNEAWGFFGTCYTAGLDADKAWALAFAAIQNATNAHDENAYGPDGVRDFLDSKDGRHFADAVADAHMTNNGDLEAAIKRATDQHMTWTISRRTERDHGIPHGLPYLTGWVQHYAILADQNA